MTTKWHVVFEDDPQNEEIFQEDDRDVGMVERFDDADKTGMIGWREVRGMWIIDHATEQANVLRIYGRVSDRIRKRFHARANPAK